MIDNGTAPSIDYKLHAREDGRIEIHWQPASTPAEADAVEPQAPAEPPTTADIEHEIAAEADGPIDHHAVDDKFGADPWPPGARVQVALSKRRVRLGTVDYQVDPQFWRVVLDGALGGVSGLYRGEQLSAPGDDAPLAPALKPAKKERRAGSSPGRPSKSADLDAAAARGVMPEKPVVTSKANPHYQKRFDFLAERAAAGDWDAVRGYEVKGINSYAKMVKQYRDRLLSVHHAQEKAEAA
jgi:hypothetical protein